MASAVGWDLDPVVAGWPGLPPLAGDVRADACVIGLGGSGLAAVEALLRRGLDVVGVDAGRVGAAAAGRNGGFLVAGPASFLHRALAEWGPCALELYRETLAEIDRLEATLGPDVVRRSGSIRLAGLPGPPRSDVERADTVAELADCARLAATLREHGIAVEGYTGPLGRGLFLPGDAVLNPARRVLVLAEKLARRARLHEHTEVTAIDAGTVTTTHGSIAAGVVIVAVDGRIDRLLPALAGRVRTARLQMLATAPVAPGRLPCAVYSRWGYDYAQQRPDGRLFVGGGRDRHPEAEWTDESSPTTTVQREIDDVARRMAGTPVTVTHRWAAPVGYTQDGRAVCAPVGAGVVVCGGYGGTGNLVGPVAARAAVDLAVDGRTPPAYFDSTPVQP